MILEKHLCLPINLGRLKRLFLNTLRSINLQLERLFTHGKHLRQLPIFPGVLRTCNAQGNFKLRKKKTQQLHLGLDRARLAFQMLKLMTILLEED